MRRWRLRAILSHTETIGLSLLILAAFVALYVRFVGEDAPSGADEQLDLAVTAETDEASTERAEPVSRPVPTKPEPAGSRQAMLLDTTDENRAHIMWLTIMDAGFECEAVRSARQIGEDGSYWRANCGSTQIYAVEVDEFGRLEVAPMPYGDGLGPRIDVITEPDQGDPTLRLREPQ